jgi:hypothetical protein
LYVSNDTFLASPLDDRGSRIEATCASMKRSVTQLKQMVTCSSESSGTFKLASNNSARSAKLSPAIRIISTDMSCWIHE